jgi:glycosyltransferase involved in cell wall biosynthesis
VSVPGGVPRQTRPARLAVYAENVYREVETPAGPRVACLAEAYGFALFVCEVGGRFERLVLLGRSASDAPGADHVLPAGVELAALPYYSSLRDLGLLARALPATVRALWRSLADVDVVWVFGPHPVASLFVVLALLRRRRVVLGVRKDALHYFRSRLPSRGWAPALAGVWVLDTFYRLVSRRLPTTVVGTEIARRYGGPRRGVHPMTVTLMRSADLADAPVDATWPGPVELLTVGRIEPEKNPLLLVDALAELERERPGRYRLTWIGSGPMLHRAKSRAEANGVAAAIDFRGFVPFGAELLAAYRAADAFVHVSLTEGVPAALVEAISSGLPVLATDVGGVSTLLEGGRGGLLVPPADLGALVAAVRRLDDDQALRERLARDALTIGRRLTIEAEADRVAAFLAGEGSAGHSSRA